MGRWFTESLAGRAFVAGLVLKLAVMLLVPVVGATSLLSMLDLVGSAAFVAAGLGLVALIVAEARRRRLLWPVWRKLSISYIFIGFVPALLLFTFFALCGVLVFLGVSSYLMEARVQALVGEGRVLAQAVALELQRSTGTAVVEVVERRHAAAALAYPGTSFVVVKLDRACLAVAGAETAKNQAARVQADPIAGPRVTAGPWAHLDAPRLLPSWVGCDDVSGIVAYAEVNDAQVLLQPERLHLAVRAVAWTDSLGAQSAVVVDIPIAAAVIRQLRNDTGIELGEVTAIVSPASNARPLRGRATIDLTGDEPPVPTSRLSRGWVDRLLEQPQSWYAFLDFTDWDTGRGGSVAVAIGMSPAEVYRRISATAVRIGAFNVGQVLMLLLSIVGGLFLVIEGVALVMGLSLARSITGAIHELFVGTSRIRKGDFTYKIPIRTRDQLGELAESFNSMTASMGNLLEQKAEKERLEQELRIARTIQMSLLPQGPLSRSGVTLAAHSEPAREVGGDYYDVLPLDGRRFGLLIADVSGKGTSAALYMAELKGLILALNPRYQSPRELLIEANRILSPHLDARSFITMTYAIMDVDASTMTYARAGHCPLIHVPGPGAFDSDIRTLAPDGLMLGLKLDNGEMFERLLSEDTIALGPGDMVVLYTDGLSEAMNEEFDCFGEERLEAAIESRRHLPFEDIRDGILDDIRTFVGGGEQHDDMTMLLLKINDLEGQGR
jgi:serine phosphatase RsbU (regulator of sigma subunit)